MIDDYDYAESDWRFSRTFRAEPARGLRNHWWVFTNCLNSDENSPLSIRFYGTSPFQLSEYYAHMVRDARCVSVSQR